MQIYTLFFLRISKKSSTFALKIEYFEMEETAISAALDSCNRYVAWLVLLFMTYWLPIVIVKILVKIRNYWDPDGFILLMPYCPGPYNNDGNTPPAYSAYERFYMGWLTPRLLTEPEYVTLPLLNETGEALVMNLSDSHPTKGWDPRPTVFYLLETRTKSGWDKYLPGSGMLITKVNYSSYKWQNNSVNNNARSMGVDIIEAKENTGNWGSSTDAFPAGATEWTELMNHEVTEITRNTADGSVSFSFRGAPKPMPQAIETPEGEVKVQKILHDGQVLIVRDGKIYDILGRAL